MGFSTITRPPVVLLAGGFGTRLRTLDPHRPKPMVEVLEKPFLFWLIKKLMQEGFTEFLISTGYLAEIIESHPWQKEFPQCHFSFHRETTPLGTGGAVAEILKKEPDLKNFWLINGDTFLEEPLPLEIENNFLSQNNLQGLFLALKGENLFDATPNLKIEGRFIVGESPSGDLFDGGALLCKREAFDHTTLPSPHSIHQALAQAEKNHQVSYFTLEKSTCYDIGTPARFSRFEKYLQQKNEKLQ